VVDASFNAGQPDRLLQLNRRVILCMNGDNAAAKLQRGDRVKDYSQNLSLSSDFKTGCNSSSVTAKSPSTTALLSVQQRLIGNRFGSPGRWPGV
jgi:hypothetical protein